MCFPTSSTISYRALKKSASSSAISNGKEKIGGSSSVIDAGGEGYSAHISGGDPMTELGKESIESESGGVYDMGFIASRYMPILFMSN